MLPLGATGFRDHPTGQFKGAAETQQPNVQSVSFHWLFEVAGGHAPGGCRGRRGQDEAHSLWPPATVGTGAFRGLWPIFGARQPYLRLLRKAIRVKVGLQGR